MNTNQQPSNAGGVARLFDVIAVNIESRRVRVMDRGMTEANAEAYINLAVMRRGVDVEFYKTVPSGTKNDGDSL